MTESVVLLLAWNAGPVPVTWSAKPTPAVTART